MGNHRSRNQGRRQGGQIWLLTSRVVPGKSKRLISCVSKRHEWPVATKIYILVNKQQTSLLYLCQFLFLRIGYLGVGERGKKKPCRITRVELPINNFCFCMLDHIPLSYIINLTQGYIFCVTDAGFENWSKKNLKMTQEKSGCRKVTKKYRFFSVMSVPLSVSELINGLGLL